MLSHSLRPVRGYMKITFITAIHSGNERTRKKPVQMGWNTVVVVFAVVDDY